jgi:hypothetical protein
LPVAIVCGRVIGLFIRLTTISMFGAQSAMFGVPIGFLFIPDLPFQGEFSASAKPFSVVYAKRSEAQTAGKLAPEMAEIAGNESR